MALLRGLALFALLVAVPFFLERLFGRNAQWPSGSLSVSDSFWRDAASYSGFGIVVLLLVGFLLFWILFLPQTYQIADWLKLAEREMNSLLRGWGGGYGNRKDVVKERAEWLRMIPVTDDPAPFADIYKTFFNLNQDDLKTGGSQGTAMGKVRITAFLLRELYEGNVKNAQLKIFNEYKNSTPPKPPFIAPGIRQIVGYEEGRFKPDIKPGDPDYDKYEYGFPRDAGVDWFPLWLTVKLNRFPRNIVMIRTDKSVVSNWDVIEELNVQAAPAIDEPAVSVGRLRFLEARDSALVFFRWVVYLLVVALTVYVLWRLLA